MDEMYKGTQKEGIKSGELVPKQLVFKKKTLRQLKYLSVKDKRSLGNYIVFILEQHADAYAKNIE